MKKKDGQKGGGRGGVDLKKGDIMKVYKKRS